MAIFLSAVLAGALASVITLASYTTYRLATVTVMEAERMLSEDEEDGEGNALFAGSFNPVHIGHVELLRAIARKHRGHTVYACVGHNPKKVYPVSPEERRALLERLCNADPQLRNVVPVVVDGYIWRFANAHGRCVMYRGIRSFEKDGAEERFLHILNILGPVLLGATRPNEVRYVVCAGGAGLEGVSSSRVRAAVAGKETIAGLVPPALEAEVQRLYARAPAPTAPAPTAPAS